MLTAIIKPRVEEIFELMVVAEGFEAGGHNGIEETTTFCLIPDDFDIMVEYFLKLSGLFCFLLLN